MARAHIDRYPAQLDNHTIVDTDVHIRVSLDQVSKYLDEPHKSHAEGGGRPSGSWNRYKGGRIDRIEVDRAEDITEGLCEQFSVDYPIINPSLSWLSRLPQPDYAVAVMQAYNDYLVDEFLDEEDNFYGLLQLAPQKPDKAAEEIDRLGDEDQIVGIYMVPMGPEAPLGDPRYDVIYEAASDHDLTVTYHSGTNAFGVEFPKQRQRFNQFVSIHTLGHLWGQMQTLVSLIEQATPVKYPDLTFVFLEAGVSWLPVMMYRLNKEYSIRQDEIPLLEKQPEEYIREFYISSQPLGEPMNKSDMTAILDIIDAPNNLVFSSDYPHWDFDNPSELFGYLDAHYSEDEITSILSENAIEAFGLDL